MISLTNTLRCISRCDVRRSRHVLYCNYYVQSSGLHFDSMLVGESTVYDTHSTLALAHLRKESLDIFNRIHSIAEDVQFVNAVCCQYSEFPVLPNLRCGAWYVDPDRCTGEAAYFKSTDGHFHNWSFNLRRPNIHLLSVVTNREGIIIVDSTRAGKRIPDALSKTVPIWCAVINRAVKIKFDKTQEWDCSFYTPPAVVSAQENRQIESKLDEWATRLCESSYALPDLRRPLRPLWITPASSSWPTLAHQDDRIFYPIICVSASRQIHEGIERRVHGFAYVQGSGDDHELWGQGLTPSLFWQHKEQLLGADRAELETLVSDLVNGGSDDARHEQVSNAASPLLRMRGRLIVGKVPDLSAHLLIHPEGSQDSIAYVLITEYAKSVQDTADHEGKRANVLTVDMPQGKRGQTKFLDHVLPHAIPFIDAHLAQGDTVCICCDTGKDTSVGVALVASQMLFNDEGDYVDKAHRDTLTAPNKKSISTRLQWIITSRPQANPSRATLKRVNEFLMTPPSLRRKVTGHE